ncbi:MAG TPA: Fe-S cluster assembly protein SufD [Candidatus Krumholzibacteria bacterium]|nr:Fe-S cluster assembly protein SufD [Candidatus Krumholzibacteria bacterium]
MPGVAAYEKAFSDLEPGLRQAGPGWLHELRRTGIDRFRALGFPSLRDEEWRFTRTRPIAEVDFAPAGEGRTPADASITAQTFDDSGCLRLVLVNGRCATDIGAAKLPAGVRVMSLANAMAERPDRVRTLLNRGVRMEDQQFAALNTAFLADGVYIELTDNAVLDRPIHIVHVADVSGAPAMLHPRLVIHAGRSSEGKIIESYIATSESQYFTNVVTEIVCEENASLYHRKIQTESPKAFHVSLQHATLAANSRYATLGVTMGGSLVRNDVHAILDGEGIDARIDGLYLASGRQHVDNHTFIRHAKPHCHSFELYKGILDGHARGVFNGRINVDQDAQKTDAKQENNCVLLSDDARINSNPQLEIFADDVKCTHGATIGKMDEEAMFYLRSRGIPANEARDIMVYAFASEVFERIDIEPLRVRLEANLFEWLNRSRAARAASE